MNFIVAIDENNGIGYKKGLLTHLPEDLKYFKDKTIGNVIVMGRETLDSLPNAKPLPNRTTIILSKNKEYTCEGAVVVNSLEELFEILKFYDNKDIFIAGGEQIYKLLIPYCKTAYITKIKESFKADKFLDPIDKSKDWDLVWESEEKEHNGIRYVFTKYENKSIRKA